MLQRVNTSVVGLMLCMAACAKVTEEPHTVSWYMEHKDEIKPKVLWCADDAARQASSNCMNAVQANERVRLGSQKDLPAINWNSPDSKQ